ncbi:hypothetical protein ACXR0O_26485 [Verrucomicrobiota bacterium sgz303538]
MGNRFLCPTCKESGKADLSSDNIRQEWLSLILPVIRQKLPQIRHAASLLFLAITVTGFVVFPALLDPAEFGWRNMSSDHASTKSPGLSPQGHTDYHSTAVG